MDEHLKDIPDVATLIASRELFSNFVYTPLNDALLELGKRQEDENLKKKVLAFLGNDILDEFKFEPRVVLARHLITPNYETLRFLSVPDSTGIKPLFFQYLEDKMIFKNPGKYYLSKLSFNNGLGKNGGSKNEYIKVIDFNEAHGKRISTLKTLQGDSFVDFHHKFFLKKFPHLAPYLFDGSQWYADNGGTPEKYYARFLALFVCHGILFENFLLDQKEMSFSRDIFLPAFLEVMDVIGVRPLIVSLEPTDIEGDDFWLSYPYAYKEFMSD